MTDIRFTITRSGGRRAWKWNTRAMRWFPMSAADADLAIATGDARNVTAQYKARQAAGLPCL